MYRRKQLSFTVSAALGFTALIAFPVFSQDAPSYDDDEMELEEVIVTGTRIIREDGFGQTSPVEVVSMEDISSFGLTRVEDVLNNLPQIETSANSFISNGASGTASLDLRGMGAKRTLVLINGRRMQPSTTEAADVNQIPSHMIERVEVLTGGASATYGADAVAGVVNFIMRRVTGVEVRAGVSGYQHDNDNRYIKDLMDKRGYEYPTGSTGIDGKAYNVDIVIGGDFANGRGNATIYATWRNNEELRQEARDYSSCKLTQSGTACGGSDVAIVPNFYIAPLVNGYMDWNDWDYLTLAPDSSLISGLGNVYNFAPINHYMRPDERWSLGAFIDYEVNEHAIAYLETGFASDYTEAQIAESGTFFFEQYDFPLNSSYFPEPFRDSLAERWPGQDEFGIYVGKRNNEGGPRTNQISNSSFRIVAGAKGLIRDGWDYDVSYLHAQTSASMNYIGDLFAPNLSTALNTEACAATPGCIPYEVFTYQGVTAEQAAFLGGTAIQTTNTSMSVINAYVTGHTGWGLAAGNIITVFGYEWRENIYERISDTVYQQGLLLGQGGATPSIDGEYNVNELFAEANIPLLANRSWAQQMTLDLAYRWSDYSTSGSSSTYRIGLDWQAVDALRIRGGYNRAVRAPNIGELFYPQTLGISRYVDPCAGATPEYSAEQCARTGVTAAQYGNILASPSERNNALYGGNPELEPEVADTITFGMVIDASDTMLFSIDYWDIDIDGVISNVPAEVTLDQCALLGNLCDGIYRSDNGSFWLGQGFVAANYQNLGRTHYQGIDLAWVYGLDAWGGGWNFDLIGTYTLKREWTVVANDPDSITECSGVISTLCFPSPEWRHTATASYDSNSFWAATARWRYYGKVDYEGTTDQIVTDNLGAQNYFDLNAVFRFMQTHDVTIGVNNVFDKEPPLMGSSLSWNANSVSGFYDTLGRYLYANVTMRW